MSRTLSLVLMGLAVVAFMAATPNANAAATYITGLVETGTGLSEWGTHYTGEVFEHQYDGVGYTVPALDEDVNFFTDRTHEYNGTSAENTIASLGFVGSDYIMSANNNRDKALQLDVTVNAACDAFLFYDARVTPPAWLPAEWTDLGMQRMGIDEGGDGTGAGNSIQNEFTIWKKSITEAGTFSTYSSESPKKNMYGIAITAPGAGPDYLAPPPPPVPVNFSYEQTDRTTGSGTISMTFDARLYGGTSVLTLSAPMPAATVTGDDPTVATAIGSINDEGEDNGVHIGWSGSVPLSATDGADVWTLEVPLVIPDPSLGNYRWDLTIEDNTNPGGDAFGHIRDAAWVGEFSDGHRHTRDWGDYAEGAQDTHTYSKSQNLGSDALGDDLGINMGFRDWDDGDGSAGFNVENMVFEGFLPGIELLLNGATAVEVAPDPLPLEPFSVVLDIGSDGQRVQAGHAAVPLFGAPGNGNNGPELDGTLVDTGTGLITLSLDATNQAGEDAGRIDWRARGENEVNPDDDLVAMGEDFVKNNGGIIRLLLDNLPAGTYSTVSYHADPDNAQCDTIRVFVDNGDGSGFVDTLAVGSADYGLFDDADPPMPLGLPDGVDSLTTAIMAGTSAAFTFEADGINPVAIIFDGVDATDTEVPLNGLSLTYVPIPEPSTLVMLVAGSLLGFGLWLRRRRDA